MSIDVMDETQEGDEPSALATTVQRLAAYVIGAMRVHPDSELSVRLVEADVIADLNAQWMDKPGPTDVLAFPMDELRPAEPDEEPVEGVLGDLVVCPSVAAQQAAAVREAGDASQATYTTASEVELLVTHGILHLLGHDHAEPDEHRLMFGLQAQLLHGWRHGGAVPDGFDPLAEAASFAPADGPTSDAARTAP